MVDSRIAWHVKFIVNNTCAIIYRCRHAVFSKYFGDSPPSCKNRCDVCKNKDEVQARIAQFEMCQTRSNKSRSNVGSVIQIGYSDDEMYVKNCLNNLHYCNNTFDYKWWL